MRTSLFAPSWPRCATPPNPLCLRRRSHPHNFHSFHLALFGDRYRQEFLRCAVSQTPFAMQPSPKKKLIGVQSVALRYLCHRRPKQERLLRYPSLFLDRPATPQLTSFSDCSKCPLIPSWTLTLAPTRAIVLTCSHFLQTVHTRRLQSIS
jgi:hypothetical protein